MITSLKLPRVVGVVSRSRVAGPNAKRLEIAGSAACRYGSSLLAEAEAVPRWNSRMGSRAPRIQPSVLREGRIAARLARMLYRYRDCHQIERLAIHSDSDGGIDIRFRDPRPDHTQSSRSAVAHVGSMGPTTPRARPVLSPRQVKKNKKDLPTSVRSVLCQFYVSSMSVLCPPPTGTARAPASEAKISQGAFSGSGKAALGRPATPCATCPTTKRELPQLLLTPRTPVANHNNPCQATF